MSIKARLQRLVEQLHTAEDAAPVGVVVIYDPATGQPLTAIDPRAELQIWIPHNGRESLHTR